MGTVTAQLTTITRGEAGSLVSIGGGPGAATQTDIYIENTGAFARRSSNGTLIGFWYDNAANINLSGVRHIGMWVWHTHYAVLTDFEIWLGTTTANYDRHDIDLNNYPSQGGWVRMWVNVNRTPDVTVGTGLNEAQTRYFALANTLPTVGGTSPNLVMDAIHHTTAPSSGLTITGGTTGTPSIFQEFVTFDEGTVANKYGVVTTLSGIIFILARLTIGNATSTVFKDENRTLVFPDQNLVADDFMGISVGLNNATTEIEWKSLTISSAGTKKGDIIVTGTTGTFDILSCALTSIRQVDLTSNVFVDNCTIRSSGTITLNGATINNSSIVNSSASSAVIAADLSLVEDCSFQSSGTGHAVELTTLGSGTMEWKNRVSGYAVIDGSTGNEALFVNVASGNLTVNVAAGYDTPSIRTAGATVTVVAGAVTVRARAVTDVGIPIQNARVILKASNDTGPFPYQEVVSITRSGSTATVTHTAHNLQTNDYVAIDGADQFEYNGVKLITVTGPNSYTYTVSGTPATPATGTIRATFVALYGLTDSNGIVSTSRVYPADQPVIGWTRKSTTAPFFKEGTLIGTVTSTSGFDSTAVMISDE